MGTEENRELGNILVAATNVADWPNHLGLFAPDAVIDLPDAIRHLGASNHFDLVEIFTGPFETIFTEWTCIAEEDRLVVWGAIRTKYLETLPGLPEARGQTVDLPIALFCRVTDARISRMKIMVSETDWLRMVG